MVFENENTWMKFAQTGKEAEQVHALYDSAVAKVKQELGKRHSHFIDGREKFSGTEFKDTSPSDTRLVLGTFQKGTREDAREAVDAALKAFGSWSATPYTERVALFRKAADVMAQRKFELSALMSLENGKNRVEAMVDVDEGIDLVRYYAEQLEVNRGFENEMGRIYPNEHTKSVLKPYGVWGVIAPFNFPFAIALGMSTGALVTGNTIVFKPASDTPLMGLKIYQILTETGLPSGVMNYVTGPGSAVGQELVENPNVSGIVFTGSRDVGVSSYKAFSSKNPRPFVAEMGGKNPVIVTARADLDKAVEGVARAAFGYGGQKCSATARVFVDRNVKDAFVEKLVKRTRELKIDDPTSKDAFAGPVINENAYNNYQRYLDIAKKEGKILCGGNVLRDASHSSGYFVEPTVVDGLPKNHLLFKDELFLPIVCIAPIDSLQEALQLANNIEYGLTAGIFSEDKKEIQTFFNQIQAGVTYANRKVGATTGAIVGAQAFVGWKLSGSSGKGAGGLYYLQQFMREQAQTVYD
ncbi:MAG: aldehyde dehydrogenase family protein [Candidatus Bathyarchaeia archaeon]